MQVVGANLLQELRRSPLQGRRLTYLVEVYGPDFVKSGECNFTSLTARNNAIARWSRHCVTWSGLKYEAELTDGFGTMAKHFGREVNSFTVSLNNVGKKGTRFVLANQVAGMFVAVRLVCPTIPNEYAIIYVGRFTKPGAINGKTVKLPSSQYYGRLNVESPWRNYGPTCPLDFGGTECLGTETLAQKSPQFQAAVAVGEAACNKTFERCAQFGSSTAGKPQTDFNQSIRFVAVSGSFTYVEVVKKKFLFFFSKKKKVYHTVQFSSQSDDNFDTDIPFAWGRVSAGPLHPIQWVNRGTTMDSTLGVCEGPIKLFEPVKVNSNTLVLQSQTEHLGEYGGVGTQQPDPRFPASGVFSRLAYLGTTLGQKQPPASQYIEESEPPEHSVVIKARLVKLPDNNGEFTVFDWSDAPPFIVRDILTDNRLGKIPECLINDASFIAVARKTSAFVIDSTNAENILLPQSERAITVPYKRYRSTGYYDYASINPGSDYYGYNQLYGETDLDNEPPITYYSPSNPPLAAGTKVEFLARRFTTNIWLTQKVKLTDFLNKSVLPTARLYLLTGADGKIECRQEDKVDNNYLRQATAVGDTALPVTSILPWLRDRSGWVIAGVGTANAEVARVTAARWTAAGNSVPVVVSGTGGLSAAITTTNATGVAATTLAGGNDSTPASAIIELSGSPVLGATVSVKIEDQEIKYTCFGTETLEAAAATVSAFINAQSNLREIVSSEFDGTKITVRYLGGFLDLDRKLKRTHAADEENIRVAYIFENCGELGFDNVLKDSFEWNVDKGSEANVVSGIYTAAAEDFQRVKVVRKARKHITATDTELPFDIDLSGVDSYRQAAELTKGKLIELRDCDLWFNWSSAAGEAFLLEEGDVVAVKHDSGDTAVNYVPLRIRDLSIKDTLEMDFTGQLYLTAQYLPDVSVKDPALAATMTNTVTNPGSTGTTGGTGGGSGGSGGSGNGGNGSGDCRYQPGGYGYYGDGFNYESYYSYNGCDII